MKNLLMFLNEHFQCFCEIDQKLLNVIRHAYCFFELQLKKLNKNSEFLFKFNIVDDDEDVNVF